jgi:hypothetical protein
MLYFSRRKIAKDKVDLKQVAKLNKFKSAIYIKSLVGFFASSGEFKRALLVEPEKKPVQPGIQLDTRRKATKSKGFLQTKPTARSGG